MEHPEISTRPLLQDPGIEDNDIDGSTGNDDSIHNNSINAEAEEFDSRAPKDRYNIWYITFYLLGIVTLMPWNFLITAHDYWMYKFRDLNSTQDGRNKTSLQAEFASYISIASTVPSIFFLIINSFISHRISIQIRMVGSFLLIFLVFIVTTVFVDVNTDTWQDLFFMLTLLLVILVNIGSALLQAGLWGIVSRFKSKYFSATVSGQALGGIFAAVVSILSLALAASPTTSALFYFLFADLTLILSLVAYGFMCKSIFFKYHMLAITPANRLQYDPSDAGSCNSVPTVHVSLRTVFYKIINYGVSVFMCFVVTISVYPAVTVLVCSSSQVHNTWTDVYFVPVISFLLYSCCDYVGRIVAGWWKWPSDSPISVVTFSFVRIIFIPLIMLCNAHPRHYLPVLIPQDYLYVIILSLFAFTNGYLTNISLICVPSTVSAEEQYVASSMMAAFLGIGCAVGSAISVFLVKIL